MKKEEMCRRKRKKREKMRRRGYLSLAEVESGEESFLDEERRELRLPYLETGSSWMRRSLDGAFPFNADQKHVYGTWGSPVLIR